MLESNIMVTFLSIFLWLITGTQTIELAVGPSVDHVEIRLDGELVATLDHAPWRTTYDFGPLIEPHELVAIAFDEDGNVVGQARQIVNLPRPEAEARIVLTSDEEGRAISLRVVTESTERLEPLNILTAFDGKVLEPEKRNRYLVPDHDPKLTHLISAEASYANGVVARADISYGGGYGQDVASTLTAIPVVASGKPPTPPDLAHRLTIGGEELRVVAVERSGVRIYVVRDVASHATLERVSRSLRKRHRYQKSRGAPISEFDLKPKTDRVHLVGVNPTRSRGISIFPVSGAVSIKRHSLEWAVTNLFSPDATVADQRLADAVAVAGLRASGHGSPRAVLLITSSKPVDQSLHAGPAVRHYLGELRVPLHVWVTGSDASTAWGPGTGTISSNDFTKATKALLADLGNQWIVWVEGPHLVNRVELDGEDLGLTLAGTAR